jgi:nucleoside-diphosphate-sugar epimerase
MKKVLITGSAGFIGFHTSIKYISKGYKVYGVDNINDYYDVKMKHRRLSELKKHDNFVFKRMDINKKGIVRLIKKVKFDVIINLAAYAGVSNSVKHPEKYYKVNVLGVLNILNAIRDYQPTTLLIQASTASVYGNKKGIFKESDKTDKPLNPYASSKKSAELLCHSYRNLHDMNILIFRFFTVYGSYGRPDMSIFRFIKWSMNDEVIKLYSPGNTSRTFTYIDDITKALYKFRNYKGYDIYNLCGNEETNLLQVILYVGLSRIALLKNNYSKSDIHTAIGSNEKIKELWKPTVKFRTGIRRVIDWYILNRSWVDKIKL